MARLKDLIETWDMICGRMGKYGTSILGANEEATRYSLIDPILTALVTCPINLVHLLS